MVTGLLLLALSATPTNFPDGGTLASQFPIVRFIRLGRAPTLTTRDLPVTREWTAQPGLNGDDVTYCVGRSGPRLTVDVYAGQLHQAYDIKHLLTGELLHARLSLVPVPVYRDHPLACTEFVGILRDRVLTVSDTDRGVVRDVVLDDLPEEPRLEELTRPDGTLVLSWAERPFERDLVVSLEPETQRLRRPTPEEREELERASPFGPRLVLPGFSCVPVEVFGDRQLTWCSGASSNLSLLWTPATGEAVRVHEADSTPRIMNDPSMVETELLVERILDPVRFVMVEADEGLLPIRTAVRLRGGPRRFDGIKRLGKGWELLVYDLDDLSVRPLRRYQASDCPGGRITRGSARARMPWAIATCVTSPDRGATGTIQWTDLIDVDRNTAWRTRLRVVQVADDGTVVLVDRTAAEGGFFTQVWRAQLR